MNDINIGAKGIRREGMGLLTDNWSRALAVVAASAFAMGIFLLLNQFVVTLMEQVSNLESAQQEMKTYSTILDYIQFSVNKGFTIETAISIILSAFYFMFVSPLNLGVVRWYQSLAQCDNLQVGQIFFYYRSNERMIAALVFELNRVARHLLYGALTLSPSALCFGFGISYLNDEARGNLAVPLIIAGGALLVAGLICDGLLLTRFFLAKYLLVNDKTMDINDSFKRSVRYMKGLNGKVLRVIIGFIPMFLLCIFIAPIVFVIPTYEASMAACAQDIIDARKPV